MVASTSSVTKPGVGPSVCDKIFRVTPAVAAGGVPWADASVAMNSVIPQIAHDAKPANPRRVSMISSLLVSGSLAPSGLLADRKAFTNALASCRWARDHRRLMAG